MKTRERQLTNAQRRVRGDFKRVRVDVEHPPAGPCALARWLLRQSGATAIHGVTDAMVADAPTFADVYPQIREALHRRRWVVYNAGYDVPRLEYEIERAYLPAISPALIEQTTQFYGWWGTQARREVYCAMEMFAEVYGSWSEYHASYTWQKLTTAAAHYGVEASDAHNALADAQVTYQILRHMALDEDGK